MIIIKTFVPTYFDKFRCIADKCPDTCCAGWEADLDGEIIEKYKTIDGELGERIKQSLAKDEADCDIFALCENGRCPFLNSCNLCDIQATHGEEFLSNTCSLFPRFFEDFGKIREMGLGFGCPEAARIMLEDDEPFSLCFYEECVDEVEDIDEDFLSVLIELRAEIFTVLEDGDLSFRNKIKSIFKLVTALQEEIDAEAYNGTRSEFKGFDECIEILEKMEYIRPERKDFVSSLKNEKLSKNALNLYRSDFEKLMKYYFFRYFLACGYDYDVVTPVKYGVFACIVISRIYAHFGNPDFEKRVKIMYSYSKEVEYSDVNMDLLDEALYRNFDIEDLINLI
ncbi:MAG: flagellin lysine-N-methylase [Clostridia bacterium]|nr:flagellin lysine-N-methylase [Clostridia bacterium]